MKKLLIILLLGLALVSCSKKEELSDEANLVNDWATDYGYVDYEVNTNTLINYNKLVNNTNYYVYPTNYDRYGFRLLHDNNNNLIFYSLISDKEISGKDSKYYFTYESLERDEVSYYVYPDSLSGFILVAKTNDDEYAFISDANGVILDEFDITNISVGEEKINEDSGYINIYYTKNVTGNKSGEYLLKLNYQNDKEVEITNEKINLTTNYNEDYLDLSLYGLEDYKAISDYNDSYLTIIDPNGNIVSSYFLPNQVINNNINMIIKGGLIIQEKYKLPDDSTDYSYYNGTYKYGLRSYKFNFLDGSCNEIELNYLINDFTNKEDFSQIYANITKIRDDKSLENEINVILDNDGKIIKEVANYNLYHLKLKNGNLYDMQSKKLYNNKMQLLADLSRYEVTYNLKYDCFIINLNNYGGIVNNNGEIIVPLTKGNIKGSANLIKYINNETVSIIEINDNNKYTEKDIILYDLNIYNVFTFIDNDNLLIIGTNSINTQYYIYLLSTYSDDVLISTNISIDSTNTNISYNIYTINQLNNKILILEIINGNQKSYYKINKELINVEI